MSSDEKQSGNIPNTPFKITPEEMRVIRECNRDSFYYRCLPLGTLLGMSAFLGVRSGFLQPNKKYGPLPKVLLATAIGYIYGKISYQQECAERIMALPNSKLGAQLRNRYRRREGFQESISLDSSQNVEDLPSADTYSDVPPSSGSIYIDSDRKTPEGLDDLFRPNVDDYRMEDEQLEMPPPSSRTTTYEDLRRKNREEYEMKRTRPHRGVISPEDVPSVLQSRDRKSENESNQPNVWNKNPKNIYGDVWEK